MYHEANCSVSSYNTTDQEFAQLVANFNATLSNNSLPNVEILEGSVIVAGMSSACIIIIIACMRMFYIMFSWRVLSSRATKH